MDILTKIWLKIKKIASFNKKSDSVFCVKKLITLSFLTVLPFISSCDYLNKCIEADDFGESQIEFLEVESNNLENKCQFDVKYLSDPLTDDAKLNGEFGVDMKKCLFIDTVTISYDSKSYTSNTGCAGFDNTISGITDLNKSQIRTMCVASCRAKCIKGDSTTTAEPDWKYTSSSLILSPETQIKITAIGSVNLRSSVTEGASGKFLPKSFISNISTSLDRKSGEPFSLFLKGGYTVKKSADTLTYYYGTDQANGCKSITSCSIKPASSFARRTLIYAKTDKSKIGIADKDKWTNTALPPVDYLYKYGGKLTKSSSLTSSASIVCNDSSNNICTPNCVSSANSCKLKIIDAKTSFKLDIKSKSGNNLSDIIYTKITKDQGGSSYYVEKTIKAVGKDFEPIDIVNSEDSIVITNSNDIAFQVTSLPFKVLGATQVQKSGFLYFSYLNSDATTIPLPLTIAFPSLTGANEDYRDPNFKVAGSGNTTKYIANWSGGHFIRKGSAFILDYSSLLNLNPNIDKINNIAFAIDYHRPAVFCSSVSTTKSEPNKNPDCVNSVIDTTTGKPNGCKDQVGLCDDNTNTYYCPSICREYSKEVINVATNFIDYMSCTPVAGQSKMSCSIKDSSSASLFSYNTDGTINTLIQDVWSSNSNCNSSKCSACFKERYKQATAPYYINSKLDQCYDLEGYSKSFTSFLAETDAVKNSYKIKEFNGYYGSLGDLDRDVTCPSTSSSTSTINQLSCSGYYKLAKSISTAEDANIEFLNILNEDLKISYNATNPNYDSNNNNYGYDNISGEVSFSTFDTKTTYRNGEMLEVKLFNDTNELKPAIINYESSGASIQTISSKSAYNFDQSGYLTRILSIEDASTKNACSTNSCYDCTVQKNGIGNFVNSKYMCHTVGVKYDSFGNPIQDSRYDEDLIKKVKLGFKIKDPDEGKTLPYSDNMGSYSVKVELKKTTNFGADLIKSIIAPVLEYVDGKYVIVDGKEVKVKDSMFEYHYKNLIADYRYKLLLNTCLMMFVMFYGLGYVMGISKLNHIELIHRAIKIGIIYIFVGKYGWQWFQAIFVTGFKDGVDYLVFNMASVFDNSPELLSAIDANYFRDKSVLFSSSDAILKMIFSDSVIFKILALLTASLFGFVYLTILGYGLMLYIYAISNATLIYLTAQFFISILFLLAPIFFILLLFGPTKEIFDNWIKHMIGLSFQQIFVLITIGLFNAILYEVIKSSLGYRVCWDEVWVINLGIIRFSLLSFWTVPAFAPREIVNIDLSNLNTQPLEGLPSLFKILSIWAIASLMRHFVTLSAEIGGKIGDLSPGGMSAVNLSKDVAQHFGNSFDKIKNGVSKAGSYVHDKTIGRLGDKINDKLFDYGKDAEARKAKEGKENKKIDNKVQSLINAGDDAVQRTKEDYLQSKINVEKGIANVGDMQKYEAMGQEEFNKSLSKIRDDAINSKFEEIRNKDPLLGEKDKKDEIKNILNEAKSGSVRNRFDDNMFYDASKAMINTAKARGNKDNQLKTRDIDNFALNKKSQDRKQEADKKEKQFMQDKSSSEFSKEMYQKIAKPAINLLDTIKDSFDSVKSLRPRVFSKDEKDVVKVKTGDEKVDSALEKQLEERKNISKDALIPKLKNDVVNLAKEGRDSAKLAARIAGAPITAVYYGAKAIKDMITKKNPKNSKDKESGDAKKDESKDEVNSKENRNESKHQEGGDDLLEKKSDSKDNIPNDSNEFKKDNKNNN